MATMREKKISQRFEMLYCKICRRNMLERQHRTLSCQHTYCQPCLQQRIDNKQIECPACQRKTRCFEESELENLPSDPTLTKIKERERELIVNCGTLCQRCLLKGVKTKACTKCVQCFRTMCETCREMHNSVPAFENHLLEAIEIVETDTMVCSRHGQNMAYICCHCVKGICVDCMFLDEHSDHKSDIEEFSIGIYTLREMISQVQIHVKEDIKELESGKKKAEEDLQMLDSIMNNIKDRLVVVQSKCEKECEFLLSLAHSAFKEPTKMAVAIFKSLALEAQNASVLIQELLLKGDEEFLKKFRNVQANVNSIRLAADHANKSNYPIAEFTPTGENMEKMLGSLKRKENGGSEGEYVSQMEKDGYMYIQQSKLRIELTQVEEKDLKRPVQFAFIDNNSVVFADLDYKFVTRIDRMGHLVAKYYQQSAEGVNSLCVYGNSMFMAVPDGITMFPLSYSPGLGCCFYKPDVTNVGKIAVKDPCTIVITDREVGQVVEFNSHTNKTKVVADQVQCPTYITVSCRNGGCQYLVTERDQHRVRVYDQDWNFVATLGGQGKNEGQLQLPRGTTVTPGGKVLVADWGNNRISQFQMDGTFERLTLTEKHGIKWPMALAYNFPDLWISEYNTSKRHAAVKCYHLPNI